MCNGTGNLTYHGIPIHIRAESIRQITSAHIHQQNGINIRRYYIEALDRGLDEEGTADFTINDLDMSMFDGSDETYRPAKTSRNHRNKSNGKETAFGSYPFNVIHLFRNYLTLTTPIVPLQGTRQGFLPLYCIVFRIELYDRG